MKYAVTVLLIPILGSAFFGKSAEAIKCHQCNDCADANNLSEATECTRMTLVEVITSLTGKLTGQRVSQQDVSMLAGKMGLNEYAPPASCFKLLMTINNEEIMSRGCGMEIVEESCQDAQVTLTCLCKGDGCNSAPAAFVHSLMAVCISLFLSFTYA